MPQGRNSLLGVVQAECLQILNILLLHSVSTGVTQRFGVELPASKSAVLTQTFNTSVFFYPFEKI